MKRISSDSLTVRIEYQNKIYRRFHYTKKWQFLFSEWEWVDCSQETSDELEAVWQDG